MSSEVDQYENVCKDEFAKINGKLDIMDVAIRGNGKPGINTRLDRLERANLIWNKLLWLVIGGAIAVSVNWVVK